MSGEPSGADRRTAERIQTHHHVVFSDYRALGPPRTGVATDRSSGGMRILTPRPEPLGTTLQIELRASPDSAEVILLEGRVVHVTPAERGQYAMGIRLLPLTMRSATLQTAREREMIAPRAATVMTEDLRPATVPAGAARGMDMSEAVTFRRIEDGGRPGSWLALFAILAMLIILILLVVDALRQEQRLGMGDSSRDLDLRGLVAMEILDRTAAEALLIPREASKNSSESPESRRSVSATAGEAAKTHGTAPVGTAVSIHL